MGKVCKVDLADLVQNLKAQGTLTLSLKVTAGAPRSEVFDILADGTLKVRLQAAPEKGKANKALVTLLKKEFNAGVEILSGQTSAKKLVRLHSANK